MRRGHSAGSLRFRLPYWPKPRLSAEWVTLVCLSCRRSKYWRSCRVRRRCALKTPSKRMAVGVTVATKAWIGAAQFRLRGLVIQGGFPTAIWRWEHDSNNLLKMFKRCPLLAWLQPLSLLCRPRRNILPCRSWHVWRLQAKPSRPSMS